LQPQPSFAGREAGRYAALQQPMLLEHPTSCEQPLVAATVLLLQPWVAPSKRAWRVLLLPFNYLF